MRTPKPNELREKLNFLYAEAIGLGQHPQNDDELARLGGWKSNSGVSNYFRAGVSMYPPPKISAGVCAVFRAAGVKVEPEWFEVPIEEFKTKVIEARRREGDETAGNWKISPAENAAGDLSELRLHPPTATNNSGEYHLNTTVIFGSSVDDDKNPSVVIGLQEAELAIVSESYQLSADSVEGDPSGDANWHRVSDGAIRITGPKKNGALNGSPLGRQKALKIEHVGTEEHEVEVVVRFPLLTFALASLAGASSERTSAPTEEAIDGPDVQGLLNAFVQKRLTREKGRPILSRATMQRGVSS